MDWCLTNHKNLHRIWAFVNIVCKIVKVDWWITCEEKNEKKYKKLWINFSKFFYSMGFQKNKITPDGISCYYRDWQSKSVQGLNDN